MSKELIREVYLRATLVDTYDGIMRLMGDAQRFDLELIGLNLDTHKRGGASVTITLRIRTNTDVAALATRLARHVSVLNLTAECAPSRDGINTIVHMRGA